MRARDSIFVAVLLSTALAQCAPRTAGTEISREHAIEIARQEVSFAPDRIDAVRAVSALTPVWRVTLRGRLPGQPPGLFDTVVIDVDRHTGEVVSIARP